MRDVNEICKSRSTTLFIPTPKIYCLTIKPSKIIWTSDVYNQDTHWEAESNQLRTSIESWGSMFPCSQQNFPCVPCSVPWKYFVDFGFPCSPNNAFVPVFPVLFSLCSYVTKKLNGHVPLFPKTPERGLPSGCKNTSIRTLSTGSFSLTPVWKRKL